MKNKFEPYGFYWLRSALQASGKEIEIVEDEAEVEGFLNRRHVLVTRIDGVGHSSKSWLCFIPAMENGGTIRDAHWLPYRLAKIRNDPYFSGFGDAHSEPTMCKAIYEGFYQQMDWTPPGHYVFRKNLAPIVVRSPAKGKRPWALVLKDAEQEADA